MLEPIFPAIPKDAVTEFQLPLPWKTLKAPNTGENELSSVMSDGADDGNMDRLSCIVSLSDMPGVRLEKLLVYLNLVQFITT